MASDKKYRPVVGVPETKGLKDGDIVTFTGYRYEQDGCMHPCKPGEETEMIVQIIKREQP